MCLDNHLSKKHKANWKMIIQHRPNVSKIMRRLISKLREIRRMNLLQFVVIPEMNITWEICN